MTPIDRSIPPKIQPIEAFSMMKPRQNALSNGIPVFYFDNPNLDLIHILLQVKTGSLYQPTKNLCNFAYSLLRESAPDLQAEEVSEKLDYYGTNFTVNVGLENVQLTMSMPKNNIPDILPIIASFCISPLYRESNLQIMKDKEVTNLAYNEQKTDYCAWRLMWREMLGDTYPAVSCFSTRETINSISTHQLQAFHKETFCAERVSLFVTGNLDADTEAMIERVWSAVPHGTPAPLLPDIPVTLPSNQPVFQSMPNCMQSSLVLCLPSMGFNDPERSAFSVLSTLTGGYFSSRLMQNLRERQGLTYGVSASSTFFGRQSIFAISSDVNAEQTQRAIDACFEELQRLQLEPVSDDELTMVKNYMAGIQLRATDTSVNTMLKYAYWYRFGLDENEMHRYLTEIKDVTAEQIIFLAKEHFSYNKFTQIIVGKYLANE